MSDHVRSDSCYYIFCNLKLELIPLMIVQIGYSWFFTYYKSNLPRYKQLHFNICLWQYDSHQCQSLQDLGYLYYRQ